MLSNLSERTFVVGVLRWLSAAVLALWGAVYLTAILAVAFDTGAAPAQDVAVAAVLYVGWGLALFASTWAFVRGRALPGGRVTGLLLLILAFTRVWLGIHTSLFYGGSWIPSVIAGAAMLLAGVNQLRPLSLLRWPAE